ncbi:response regulator transcription factor [Sphingobacterium spiritivorum]|uniref:response regulator transcription factor n=1 Tax=Sphingobacterium spiritivorum TaxID=258 RepID=UPI003DA4D395
MFEKTIKIAIVDDHLIVLEGLSRLIESNPEYTIAGTFTHGYDFLTFVKTEPVDIVLLDISLPDISGIDLCLQIKKAAPDAAIIAISNHIERSIILQMLQNGAVGYLLKNVDLHELKNALNEALSGKVTFSSDVKEIIARPHLHDLIELPKLTKREKEILQHIALGKTTTTIADELFLSPLTIETHRKRMMSKFKAKNMAALIKTAMEHNLI